MKNAALINLVTHAVSLDREIAEKMETLKQLKADLIAEARIREMEHQRTEGGGQRWTAEGADGCVARVAFPAPTLKGSIPGEAAKLEKIRRAAGALFERLFVPATAYKPIPRFREEAEALLGRKARQLIKLCQSESVPRVSFETKEAGGRAG